MLGRFLFSFPVSYTFRETTQPLFNCVPVALQELMMHSKGVSFLFTEEPRQVDLGSSRIHSLVVYREHSIKAFLEFVPEWEYGSPGCQHEWRKDTIILKRVTHFLTDSQLQSYDNLQIVSFSFLFQKMNRLHFCSLRFIENWADIKLPYIPFLPQSWFLLSYISVLHLLQLMKQYYRIVINWSPYFTLGFTLCIVQLVIWVLANA